MKETLKKILLLLTSCTAVTVFAQEKSHSLSQIPQREQLNGTAWLNFKNFWKKLNNIEPNTQEGASEILGSYFMALTYEEGEELQKLLTLYIDALKEYRRQVPQSLSLKEISLLEKVCKARITYLTFGNRSMVTRMIPDPAMVRKEINSEELEKRIDVLISLKEKGIIDEKEMQTALENITQQIMAFSGDAILSEYFKTTGEFQYVPELLREPGYSFKRLKKSLEENLLSMEKRFKEHNLSEESFNHIEEQYHLALEQLNELEKLRPRLTWLISELER